MVQLLENPKEQINLNFTEGYFHAANINKQHSAKLFLQALNIQQQFPLSQLEDIKEFINQVMNLTDHFVSNKDSEEAMVLREIHEKANELLNSFNELAHV